MCPRSWGGSFRFLEINVRTRPLRRAVRIASWKPEPVSPRPTEAAQSLGFPGKYSRPAGAVVARGLRASAARTRSGRRFRACRVRTAGRVWKVARKRHGRRHTERFRRTRTEVARARVPADERATTPPRSQHRRLFPWGRDGEGWAQGSRADAIGTSDPRADAGLGPGRVGAGAEVRGGRSGPWRAQRAPGRRPEPWTVAWAARRRRPGPRIRRCRGAGLRPCSGLRNG